MTVTTGSAHTESALFALRRELTDLPVIARFCVDGEPKSKARPRFGKGGKVYTPAETLAAERAIGYAFNSAARGFQPNKTDTYGLMCLFFQGTRRRMDVDNMVKLVSDGLNGVAWADDNQVSEVGGRKQYCEDLAHARTEVIVYRTGIVEKPTMRCQQCGTEFPTYTSWKGVRRFCSKECTYAASRARRRTECAHCGKVFQSAKGATFCSVTCSNESHHVTLACIQCGSAFTLAQSTAAQRKYDICSTPCREAFWRKQRLVAARGTCSQCGGPTSKKTYKRCQVCANAHRTQDAA